MTDRQNAFDQPVEYNLITYNNFRKIETSQRYDYGTGCLFQIML